jgi:hypothetical protein
VPIEFDLCFPELATLLYLYRTYARPVLHPGNDSPYYFLVCEGPMYGRDGVQRWHVPFGGAQCTLGLAVRNAAQLVLDTNEFG